MNSRFQLWVEGQDDLHVSCHLALKHNDLCEPDGKDPRGSEKIVPRFRVHSFKPDEEPLFGVDALLKRLPEILKAPSYDRLGIVVDADDDPMKRWKRLRSIFINRGLSKVPLDLEEDGVVFEDEDQRRIGLWIWPDNKSQGMLENFIETMIPANDRLLPQAKKCVVEAIAIDRRFPESHQQKAVIHTWLAWQETTGRPQGVAIQAGFLDSSSGLAQKYVAWLRHLFA